MGVTRTVRHDRGIRAALRSLAAAAMLCLAAPAAHAAPEGDTLKLGLGSFTVIGTYSMRSCAAQSSVRSARGAPLGFSIYWIPGRSLYVLANHPNAAQVPGNAKVQFRFPSGQAMAFAMTRNGNTLYTNIGFGGTAQDFYRLIEANPAMRVEIPSLGDAADIGLGRRREVESAMRHCRDWLRS